MFCRVPAAFFVGAAAIGAALGAEGPPPLSFSLEAYRARCAVGTPVLVKITVRNTGEQDYKIVGDPGWGRWMSIASAREGEGFKELRPDAPEEHIMAGGYSTPVYRFTGTLAPGARQRILQMIRTTEMAPGQIRLKAILYQGHATGRHVIETAPITVELLTKLEDDEPPVLSKLGSQIGVQIGVRSTVFIFGHVELSRRDRRQAMARRASGLAELAGLVAGGLGVGRGVERDAVVG